MKKIFPVLLLSVFMFGCSKKDDLQPSASSLSGRWMYVKVDEWFTADGSTTTTKKSTVSHPGTYIEFRSDGSFLDHNYDEGNGTISDDDSYNYKIAGDQVTFFDPGDTSDEFSMTIQKLTDTELVLYSKHGGDNGVDLGTTEEWGYFKR